MPDPTPDHTHVWQATIAATDERAEIWQADFGRLTVPIVSPIMEAASLPTHGIVAVYLLDVATLDDQQRYRLAHGLGHRFKVPLREAVSVLDVEGVPLLADGLTISTRCCDYLPADHVTRPHEPAFSEALRGELKELQADPQRVMVGLSKLDAFVLMGVLQIAVKHPHLKGEPLVHAIETIRLLQSATCPPASARERVALCGWTGR